MNLKRPFEMVYGYLIKTIYSDELSEISSFFKKEHSNGKEIDKEILEEKQNELNEILKDAWINGNPDRIKAFLNWLNKYFSEWEKNIHPHLSGLEGDFFLKMKQDPCDEYLILRGNTSSFELTNKEQAGLISNLACKRKNLEEPCKSCEDSPCLKWTELNGKKFRDIFNESYEEELSQGSYKVYKNTEKKLSEFFLKD